MRVVSYDQTEVMNAQTEDYRSIVHNYYGKVTTIHEGPQAYLVEMPDEGSTIHPHFHDIDQFQVVVRGGGRLGRDQVGPVAFHYADAYTPYGPIIGAKEGIDFFTIRAACVTGFFPMPGSRDKIVGKPGRNLQGKFETGKPLPAPNQSTRETLVLDQKDGVEVVGLRLGPNASAAGEPANAGHQYYIVCTGSLLDEGKEVPPLALIQVQPGEAAPTLRAGPKGAELLLLLQLPKPSDRPGSKLKSLAERGAIKYTNEGLVTD